MAALRVVERDALCARHTGSPGERQSERRGKVVKADL
jgi:hypothetical protein